MLTEKVKLCHKLREEIKTFEDKLKELQERGDKRKEELVQQMNNDSEYLSIKEEFEKVSSKHASSISEFARETDAMLTEFGGENV